MIRNLVDRFTNLKESSSTRNLRILPRIPADSGILNRSLYKSSCKIQQFSVYLHSRDIYCLIW